MGNRYLQMGKTDTNRGKCLRKALSAQQDMKRETVKMCGIIYKKL